MRKKRNKKRSIRRAQRDTNAYHLRTLDLLRSPLNLEHRRIIHDSDRIGNDRRRWAPTRDTDLNRVDGRKVRITLASRTKRGKRYSNQNNRISYASPKNVSVCQRRKARRKALFARKKAGRGIKGPKYRRLIESSKIRC